MSSAKLAPVLLLLSFGVVGVSGCVAAPQAADGVKKDGGTPPPDFSHKAGDACGAVSQPCCDNQTCPNGAGLQCKPNKGGCCVAVTNTCAKPTDCCSGLSCTDGKCCGSSGGACSNSNDCCSGMTCNTNKVCAKATSDCGASGKACCTGNSDPCNSGLACVSSVCKTCGAPGQPCCANDKCSSGNECDTDAAKCKVTCGTDGDPCCKGATPCTDDSTCDTNSGKCSSSPTGQTMGGAGQPCNNGKCNNGTLTCNGNTCQKPSTSGSTGATCNNSTCTNGLVCDTASNSCQPAGTMKKEIQDLCSSAGDCQTGLKCAVTQQPEGNNAKSCCVGAGTDCPNGDFDCCGLLSCIDGTCTANANDVDCLSNEDCLSQFCGTDGFCASSADAPECLGQGYSSLLFFCSPPGSCCSGAVCAPVAGSPYNNNCCYPKGHDCVPAPFFSTSISTGDQQCCGHMACGEQTNVCECRQAGSSCLMAAECCDDGAVCQAGTCFVAGVTPVAPGGVCASKEQCIPSNGSEYACSQDLGNGTNACCTTQLQTKCGGDNECCSPLKCAETGYLSFRNRCCAPPGQTCGVDDDCCGHSSCDKTAHICTAS